MKNSLTFLFFTLGLFLSFEAHSNHCSGGHKEVKDKKETTTSDTSKEVKTN